MSVNNAVLNRIFVAYKPENLSSNAFLATLKRKYNVKKAGYSGTLDPFAKGVLIVAFGSYTRLFRFLKKTPKRYECTLWLGASSKSLDTHNITKIDEIQPFSSEILEKIRQELLGEIEFTPPKFSAKRIEGKRAYKLAAKGEEVALKPCLMSIYESEILGYKHPYLSLRLSVSEGAYIRSYCELFAQKLGINATLSSLERLSEGDFVYENEKPLDIMSFLNLPKNELLVPKNLENGTKIALNELKIQKNGEFLIDNKENFSIISVNDNVVRYILNKVEKC